MSFLVSYMTSFWINPYTNHMVEQIFEQSYATFPALFKDQTSAKIYFFVLVNKQLLLEDSVLARISGRTQDCKLRQFRALIEYKKPLWQKEIQNLNIFPGSKFTIYVQGNFRTPGVRGTTIETAWIKSRDNYLGFSLSNVSFSHSNVNILENGFMQDFADHLAHNEIPVQKIIQVLRELHTFHKAFDKVAARLNFSPTKFCKTRQYLSETIRH